jgi:dTDP-4-dehydrorhamnose reductase
LWWRLISRGGKIPRVSERPTALVLGAPGTLGRALSEELPALGWRVGAAARADGDLRDEAAITALLARWRPAVVFNAAAYTDVDRAESEPELAEAVNVRGAEIVARAAAAAGAVVLHYSTDFVFDGELERPYDERDAPAPLGAYARSKLAGERLVAAAGPRHFVVRVGCLYGRGGRNFPSTLVRRLRAGETLRVDRERRGSPTWVREVARVSSALARTEHFGLYHCTAHGETSWAAFAQRVARLLDLPESRIEEIPTAALRSRALRPRRAILDNRNLRAHGLDTLSAWEEALPAYVAEEQRG